MNKPEYYKLRKVNEVRVRCGSNTISEQEIQQYMSLIPKKYSEMRAIFNTKNNIQKEFVTGYVGKSYSIDKDGLNYLKLKGGSCLFSFNVKSFIDYLYMYHVAMPYNYRCDVVTPGIYVINDNHVEQGFEYYPSVFNYRRESLLTCVIN